MSANVMTWKGRELLTVGDLITYGIDKCETPEEAQEFMADYRKINEHAESNIGYLSGYYDHDSMRRIQQWFGAAHPIFGDVIPNPEEAFAAGKAMGENIKRK